MPKIVHGDDNDPIGRMEIDEQDRAQIRAISARRALRWAIIVTAILIILALLELAEDPTIALWQEILVLIAWFVGIYLGIFLWSRSSMLAKLKDMMDAHNAQLRTEYQQLQEDLRNGRTADSSRLADQRPEG